MDPSYYVASPVFDKALTLMSWNCARYLTASKHLCDDFSGEIADLKFCLFDIDALQSVWRIMYVAMVFGCSFCGWFNAVRV
jgi:hypothetical protein